MDATSSWLLPRSTAIGWLNEEDTMSSKHLWWGPFTSTFWEHWFECYRSVILYVPHPVYCFEKIGRSSTIGIECIAAFITWSRSSRFEWSKRSNSLISSSLFSPRILYNWADVCSVSLKLINFSINSSENLFSFLFVKVLI